MLVEKTYVLAWAVLGLCLLASAVLSGQICSNCGIGPECSAKIDNVWPISRYSDCWELCDNALNCTVATLDETSNCTLYACSEISQRIGGKTYRKSSNTDCPEFEIYVHPDYEGKCSVIATDGGANSSNNCLERCLETPLCRGSTYDESTSVCYHHSNVCSAMLNATSKTYIQRSCVNEQPACIRNYTQTCVNCRAGYLCHTNFYQTWEPKPFSTNTSVFGVDPDVEQVWYIASGSSYMYIQCSYVTQAIGDTVYRATCTQDCPKFEILTLSGHRGTCPELASLSGGVTLEFCLDKCLDMENCRGVSFEKNMQRCTFHNCTSYTPSTDHDFIARRCMNDSGTECDASSKIIQTCLGCAPGPNCPSAYADANETLYTSCLDFKASDNESIMVYYDRNTSLCKKYQCSQVQQYMAHIVFRESCNSDCPKFEIFQLDNYGGSCDVIDSEEGGLSIYYCMEKCLDKNGCRGITHNSTTGRCDYHNCSNRTALSGLTYMWKRCLDNEQPRDNQQICTGCTESHSCQGAVSTQSSLLTWENCQAHFINTSVSELYIYNTAWGTCRLINCTMIQHHNNMFHIAFRKSPSSDCPIYRLFKMYKHVGTCPIIGYDEGGVDLHYCIDKCLDMDGCRSVSYDHRQLNCFYHNCTERDASSGYSIFVKRVCMTYAEFNPVKPYTQTIRNFKNQCSSDLSLQTNQTIVDNCNTTCDECDNVVYDPLSEECRQYQCDRPYGLGRGLTMKRKTVNPDCLHFEILARTGSAPNCEAFKYDEGVTNAEFCISRCFDLSWCLSALFDKGGRNCSYHACADYISENTLKILAVKNCFSGCRSPITQLCLNCQQGTLCQSFFYHTTTSDGSTCQAMCDTETACEGALYDSSNMECQLFQCPYVTQQYGSMFYRTSCNTDCPIYEMYILEGYSGICDIITNMTEYVVLYPEICYERCLDTAGCRGVTHVPSTLICYYHYCDCHAQYSAEPNVTFMWKYCLEDESSATVLPQTNSTGLSDIYPTTPGCKPEPEPIYLMPCVCSTGAFANLTTEEIVQQLIDNLTIDAASTSASVRRLTSAEDKRPSAVAVGTLGIAILASMVAAVVAVDFPNFIKTLKHVYKKMERIIKPKKTTQKRPNSNCSIESLDHLYAKDSASLKELKTERREDHLYNSV